MNFEAMAIRLLTIRDARGPDEYERLMSLVYERSGKHIYWELRDAIRCARLN